MICCAKPSAIAVLPTPGSPISTGLFFVRRDKTSTTRVISFERPITGSGEPSRATAVKSRAKLSSVGVFTAWVALVPLVFESLFPSKSRTSLARFINAHTCIR